MSPCTSARPISVGIAASLRSEVRLESAAMASCCDPNGLSGMFDEKHARSKARRYRQSGLDADARRVVDVVGERIAGQTVLEVGGGIGAIQIELLRLGAVGAENVEVSPGYEGVARLVLARPERRNAFDAALVAELARQVRAIDRAARVVILASEGETFCAGADVEWMRGMADYTLEENVADSEALAQLYRAFYELPMPLVARVQGPAIGGGAGMVAVSDLAVASTAAFFAFTEVRLGILPAVVSPYVVRKVGP